MSEESAKPGDTEEKGSAVEEELCEKVDFEMLEDRVIKWIQYRNFNF